MVLSIFEGKLEESEFLLGRLGASVEQRHVFVEKAANAGLAKKEEVIQKKEHSSEYE